jgi:transcriptional regulator with XRE-family HTH domain
MLFGNRLRKLREDKGLTQAELGKLIGVSGRVVGYYEVNVRFPKKPETLQNISTVFDVSIDYLVGTDGTFVQDSVGQFGYAARKQAKELLKDVWTIFASEYLLEEDKEEFFRLITEMYFEAKNNKKHGRS